jgi:hypothetical protein
MLFADHIINQRWFRGVKLFSLFLIGLALMTEILPEDESKIIVVPALIIVLVLGIVEVKENGKRSQSS